MSDPVFRRVRRSIDEAKSRGGMQAGMPKVTIDASDAERLCILSEGLIKATSEAGWHERQKWGVQTENEALWARVAEISEKADRLSFAIVHSLTDDQQEPLSSQFADLQDAIVANSSKPWLLRKQAEAVENLLRYYAVDSTDYISTLVHQEAQHLRQQADDMEYNSKEKSQ